MEQYHKDLFNLNKTREFVSVNINDKSFLFILENNDCSISHFGFMIYIYALYSYEKAYLKYL